MKTALLVVLAVMVGIAVSAAEPASGGAQSELEQILSEPLPEAEPQSGSRAGAISASVPAAKHDLYPEIRVRVTSPRHTILSSQTAGRVDAISVRDGDRFEASQLLVELDPTFEKIQLSKAEANLQRHRLILQMTEELVALGTKGELELSVVKADIGQAEAEVAFSRARLEQTRVLVPFAGRVGGVFVKEFQIVAEGQPLVEVIDESRMELEFIVSSQWMRWFKPGFAFSVTVDETGRTYQAVLERLGGKVDPLSKSVNAYARLVDADGFLMEGMSGEAFIKSPAEAEHE